MSKAMDKLKSILRSEKFFDTCINVFVVIFILIEAYPIWYVIIASVSDPSAVRNGELFLLPVGLSLDGYKAVIEFKDIWRGYANTIFYTVAGTLINLLVTIPCAYALSRNLGIKIISDQVYQTEWDEKKALLFAGDNLPDLFLNAGFTRAEAEEYANEGYFLNLNDYMDIMPNVKALLDENPDYKAYLTSEDGGIYYLGRLNARSNFTKRNEVFMSMKWLENLGLEEPKSLDDFYNVLVAFKEQDANGNGDPNDEIPFLFTAKYGTIYSCTDVPVLWAHGIYSNTSSILGITNLVNDDGQFYCANTTENYKDYLKFMHRLYEEELMNQDFSIISSDERDLIIDENRAGIYETGMINMDNLELRDTMDPVAVNGFTSEYNPEKVVVSKRASGGSIQVAINAETEYAEEICKFLDYLCTEEGIISGANGYPGKTFEWKEVAGAQIPDHSPMAEAAGYGTDESSYRINEALPWDAFALVKADTGTIYTALANCSTKEEMYADDLYAASGINAGKAVSFLEGGLVEKMDVPDLAYTAEEGSERSTLITDINNYHKIAYTQFINGELDIDADFDAYVAELEKIGLDRLLEIEQAAYDRMYK